MVRRLLEISTSGTSVAVIPADQMPEIKFLLDAASRRTDALLAETERLETAVAEAHRLLSTVPPLMHAHANRRWEEPVAAWLSRNAPAPVEKEAGP
jgi:hypothetical protein